MKQCMTNGFAQSPVHSEHSINTSYCYVTTLYNIKISPLFRLSLSILKTENVYFIVKSLGAVRKLTRWHQSGSLSLPFHAFSPRVL